MATVVTRQPFAQLDKARLQSLTSLKNRQNAISAPQQAKRKATDAPDADDSENVDPAVFAKRSKGVRSFFPTQELYKSSVAIKRPASPGPAAPPTVAATPPPTVSSPRPRTILQPKSPAAKLRASSLSNSSPLTAPAARSTTRGRRSGILSSRRRTAAHYSRVDPQWHARAPSTPFSLDAALQGTAPSYAPTLSSSRPAQSSRDLLSGATDGVKDSWFFDIHEDTPEQEMTNLLQHGTTVLDISSDEEVERKASRERAEGRNKENIPPAGDVSQTAAPSRSRRAAAASDDEKAMVLDGRVAAPRDPLTEMNVADFYATGCDGDSVFIVPGDDDEIEGHLIDNAHVPLQLAPAAPMPLPVNSFDFATQAEVDGGADETPECLVDGDAAAMPEVDEILREADVPASLEAVLEPIDGAGESFEVWESGSAKDEAEAAAAAASPAAASPSADL